MERSAPLAMTCAHRLAHRLVHAFVEIGDHRVVLRVVAERGLFFRGGRGHAQAGLVEHAGLQERGEGLALLGLLVAAGHQREAEGHEERQGPETSNESVHGPGPP
jgi:hypothetical protein